MTQQEKNLLFKDLCCRIPYGVICKDIYGNVLEVNGIDNPNTITLKCSDKTFWTTDLDKCKPYLFPLWRMTKKQREDLDALYWIAREKTSTDFEFKCVYSGLKSDWFDKNHFDYRGLIPMGLALDATNLGIYE